MPRLLRPSLALGAIGFSVLALEVALPRLLAPRVGTSAEVWAVTFAVFLTATAAGNALGGWISSGGPRLRRFGTESHLLKFAILLLLPNLFPVRSTLPGVDAWPLLPRTLALALVAAGPGFLLL